MRRSSIVSVALLAGAVAGCSAAPSGSASGPAPPGSAEPRASAGRSIFERVALPDGFPVLPGAIPVPMPDDDPGLIALWETDQAGSAAFDFYVNALPAAGYPVVGLYPGGEFAVIRFGVPGDAIWQVVTRATPGGRTAVEVRLDRP
jgi:hypothetical protein